jgi:glycosyltransferase involved in cell wall biosynthesis
MTTTTTEPVVVLFGNSLSDRQQSMIRFHDLMRERLVAAGAEVESLIPPSYLSPNSWEGKWKKWIGYIDKYITYPLELCFRLPGLRLRYPGRRIVIHLCDHGNGMYIGQLRWFFPVLVTCHDLFAVRGSRGEETDCYPSMYGFIFQWAIWRGLMKASEIACVSRATQSDLVRLAGDKVPPNEVIPLSLNHPHRAMPQAEAMPLIEKSGLPITWRGYILHVGSCNKRKNREAVLQTFAAIKDTWKGKLVFAGDGVTPDERDLARKLGIEDRVHELQPDNDTLTALYSAALALVFPSRFEGFGWPILEAQMAECPVICSNRTSVPEVAGDGGLVHEPDDFAGMGADVLRLENPAFRAQMTARGLANAKAYTTERLITSYREAYRRLAK